MRLTPGPNALTVPRLCTIPQKATPGQNKHRPARTKPKQEHPRSSDLNPVDKKISFPTHRGRKEYSLLIPERCTCSTDANS